MSPINKTVCLIIAIFSILVYPPEPAGEITAKGPLRGHPANPGAEYLVYLPESGSVTVDLSAAAGELSIEWLNPGTGEITPGGTVKGGGQREFTAPFDDDAVLYLARIIRNE